MKKQIKLIALCAVVMCATSCATVFGGAVSECQRTKPLPGEPSRKIRIIPLLFDSPVGWIIDFSTGAIYKPCVKKNE